MVLADLLALYGEETHLHRTIPGYREFIEATRGSKVARIDIEEFAAYLDYRHAFGVLGTDTWSQDGNRDQFLLRWGIGRVLHAATPRGDELPELYIDFARNLRPKDLVVSFNYDLLLEHSLEHVGQPYRRFPNRFTSVYPGGGVSGDPRDEEEVRIIKPHGSLDWVSRASYDRKLDYMDHMAVPGIDGRAFAEEHDVLFGPNGVSPVHSLVDGPRLHEDPLAQIQVIDDPNSYYANRQVAYTHPPLILAPSDAKQLYGLILRELWAGLAGWGFGWGGISIVGYSLPSADAYAQQVIYEIVRGYQTGLEDPGFRIGPMHPVGLVDKRSSPQETQALLSRYRFLPPDQTQIRLAGFDTKALETIFPTEPIAIPEP